MRKKALVTVLAVLVVFAFAFPAFGATAAPAPSVVLDGKTLSFDVPPMIDNGRTLVPLRAIFEAMGATVTWDPNTKTATGVKGDITVILPIGSVEPTINGVVKKLDVPAKIVNGRTLAPLRFVGEAFGGSVSWDNVKKIATITSAGGAVTPPSSGTTAPASLTGDKAAAYSLIAGAAIGTADMTLNVSFPETSFGALTVKTNPTWECDLKAPKTTGPWDAGIAGSGTLNCSFAPFSELTDKAKLETLLKDATEVKVAGDTISITSKIPASFLTTINKVNEGTVVFSPNYSLTYDIVVAGGKVTAINNIKGSGTAALLGSDKSSSFTGTMTFK